MTVQLTGENGNAFMIIGLVRQALRDACVSDDEGQPVTREATSGDYDDLLATCMRWVDIT